MTLGPLLILLSLLEDVRTKWSNVVSVYGRVPFFYFIVHFYLIHTLTVIVFFASGHTAAEISDPGSPFLFRPAQFGYSLGIVYIIWIAIVASLYFPCRWFSQVKLKYKHWWLKYI
jgi:hypothetical protein